MTKYSKYAILFLTLVIVAMAFSGFFRQSGVLMVLLFILAALQFRRSTAFSSFSFTFWVFAFVSASMFFPKLFGVWLGYDLKGLIVPLIQIIMFGMGTTLSPKDFSRILVMPWPVFIGMLLQFTIMPFAGYGLATLFNFPPEVGAGLILIGCCPGGVASNVMTYLAGGNVALSVTMTACSTLMSPVMTPFMFKMLAGQLVPVHFMDMMLSILNMIIVPIVAGLMSNKILYDKRKLFTTTPGLGAMACGAILAAAILLWLNSAAFGPLASLHTGLILGALFIALVTAVKWLVYVRMNRRDDWMSKALPVLSMVAICFIIAIITARSSQALLDIGPVLLCATMAHNLIGYALGYFLCKPLRLNEIDARTVAIEVGMQNGGMASGLAMEVLKSSSAALAPAIFGPWQNISGSILASFWKKRSKNFLELVRNFFKLVNRHYS
jgi:bile acid:Na+ symporter, BASS family